jgi:hypothetical protein
MDLNTGIIQVSRNHELPIPLHDSTHKVSTSHLTSSQVDEPSSTTTLHFNSLIPLTASRWELSRSEVSGILAESRYIVPAPTAQKTSHMVPIIQSGVSRRGQVTWLPLSEFIVALTVALQRAINTRNCIVACVFWGFPDSTGLAWGKYATIFSI